MEIKKDSIQFLLAGVELVVSAALTKEIVVVTALDDHACFQNHDAQAVTEII